jgi:hypothetical protein
VTSPSYAADAPAVLLSDVKAEVIGAECVDLKWVSHSFHSAEPVASATSRVRSAAAPCSCLSHGLLSHSVARSLDSEAVVDVRHTFPGFRAL